MTRALVLLAALGVGACAAQRPPTDDRGRAAMASELSSARDGERLAALVAKRQRVPASAGYRIGPEDLLEIRIPDLIGAEGMAPGNGDDAGPPVVAGVPTFRQGVRVDAAGAVTIPAIGTVKASGLTAPELEREIARRLVAGGILVAPEVSVLIAEYRSRVVAVIGSVERPGLYPVSRPGASVADLIWTAGGPSREAGRLVAFSPAPGEDEAPARRVSEAPPVPAVDDQAAGNGPVIVRDVRIERAPDGRRVAIVLSCPPAEIRDFLLTGPSRLVIDVDDPDAAGATRRFAFTDDLVTGARAGFEKGRVRTVLDLSRDPDGYRVAARGNVITVALGKDASPGASVGAGGRCGAGVCSAEPIRDPGSPGDPIRIDLDALLQAGGDRGLDPEVRAGDVISIAPAGTVQVHGWVAKSGSYPITRGLTVGGAVAAAGGQLFPADLQRATVSRALGPRDRQSFVIDLNDVEGGGTDDVPVVDGDIVRLPAKTVRLIPYGLWALVREVVRIGGNVVLF